MKIGKFGHAYGETYKRTWRQPVVSIISLLLFVMSIIPSLAVSAQAGTASFAAGADDVRITAMGAIVIDFETGMEIYSHNADVYLAPASMIKMMTVYLVYEAIAKGEIGFETIVPISGYVAMFSIDDSLSNVPLSQYGVYTVDELLGIVITASASAAADALAELVGGTERVFCQMMNDKAEQWGIDAVFASTYGGGATTQMTPRAMATLVRNTLLHFPHVLEKTSKTSVTFKGQTYRSTNRLLSTYDGADGFKTGTSPVIGENLSATAQRGDIRIISVTMGSGYDRRYSDTITLLDYGFAEMEEYRRIEAEALGGSQADLDDLENSSGVSLHEEAHEGRIDASNENRADDAQINTPLESYDISDGTVNGNASTLDAGSEAESVKLNESASASPNSQALVTLEIAIGVCLVGLGIATFLMYKKKRKAHG